MRIYAIDDEPKMLRMLHDAIAEAEPSAEILDFSRAPEVMEALSDPGKKPDVVFSDIDLPGISGLTLVVKIKAAAPQARLVFVTGFDQYALEAYRIHAHGYLLKPVDTAAIREELDQMPEASMAGSSRLYARCFGPFEVFSQGRPLLFQRRKTKELLAFLIDRRGATCSSEEIGAVLWEDEADLRKTKHQLRNLVSDLRQTLEKIGMGDPDDADKLRQALVQASRPSDALTELGRGRFLILLADAGEEEGQAVFQKAFRLYRESGGLTALTYKLLALKSA